jgi:WD repeat-containing protein 48
LAPVVSVNIGRWVLRNLFTGFVREEQRVRRLRERAANDGTHQPGHHRARHHPDLQLASGHRRTSSESSAATLGRSLISSAVVSSPEMAPALLPNIVPSIASSQLQAPMIPLHVVAKDLVQQHPLTTPVPTTPVPQPPRSHPMAQPPPYREGDHFAARPREPPLSSTGGQPAPLDEPAPWTVSRRAPSSEQGQAQTPGTPVAGSLMGRLKNFGKGGGRKGGDVGASSPNIGVSSIPDSVSTGEVRCCVGVLSYAQLMFLWSRDRLRAFP